MLLYTICYLHVISNSNLNYLLVYQLFGIILRLTRFPCIMMMNFGMMIAGLKAFQSCREQLFLHIFWGICLFRYFFRASLRNIWCSPVRKTISEYLKMRHYSCIFLTFSDKRIQIFPVVFESANWSIRSIIQQFSLTVSSPKTIVFLVLRMRCKNGKWFVFVAYWCFPVTEDCFERSFPSKTERFLPFSRTENA